MTLINQRIDHKRFGEGTIVFHEKGKISVRFAANDEVKSFVYPDSFETFLKLSDPVMEKMVHKELESRYEQIAAQEVVKQKEFEEATQKIAMEKFILAAEKKKAPKKRKTEIDK